MGKAMGSTEADGKESLLPGALRRELGIIRALSNTIRALFWINPCFKHPLKVLSFL
jgi:hypothetical protein